MLPLTINIILEDLESALSEHDVLGVLYSLNMLEVEAIQEGVIDQIAQDSINIRLRIAARLGWIQSH